MAQIPNLSVSSFVRRVVLGLGTGLGIGLVLLLLRPTRAVEQVELALVDVRTRHFIGAGRDPDPRIVIAEVREDDVRQMLGRAGIAWPWTEDILQYLPLCLKEAGAAGLVIDMLYFDRGQDPEDLSPEVRAQRAGPGGQLEAEHGAIALFADALRDFGPAVLAFQLSAEPQWETEGRVAVARPLAHVQVEGEAPPDPGIARGADFSVRPLLASGRTLGYANAVEDFDGIVRQGAPVARWGDRPVPSLSLAAARLLEPEVVATRDTVRIGKQTQRLDADGKFLANFLAKEGEAYARRSPFQLIDWGVLVSRGEPLPAQAIAELKGRIVVFGANILGHEDFVGSPIAEYMHGPELQAVLLDNLLHGDGRVRASPHWNTLLLLLLCALLGLLGTTAKRRLLPVLVSVLAALLLGVGAYQLFKQGWSIDLFTPWLGIGLTTLATTGLRLFTEGRRNKWLETTFSHYLAPDVIKALQADPSRLALGGRRRELTIMFSDVASFTNISEQLPAQHVVRLLNEYLTGQSARVMDEGGTIDKFEGDAIMAFWGDPLDMDDHAVRACRSAVLCIRALPALEPVWREYGLESFSIRIGLNTGEALVGNMGSDKRFDYTAMGDTVNLASRLESANKHFGSVILIGPQTYEKAKDRIVAKPLADLVVVGKSEPVAVYELVSLAEDATDAEKGHVEAFTRAHRAIRSDDLAGARTALEAARALRPDDGPCDWLSGLMDRLSSGEVPRPWDGREVLQRK